MVVLVPESVKGRRWANRALERIGEEAEAIGVSLNEDKTRQVRMAEPGAMFAFLGFEFRWKQSSRSGKRYPNTTPRPIKRIEVLRKVRAVLRRNRSTPLPAVVKRVNQVVRGWVNYFRVGNSSRALAKVRYEVEKKVRGFATRRSGRKGYGWNRWSSKVVYQTWGLYDDYKVQYRQAKARSQPNGNINSLR